MLTRKQFLLGTGAAALAAGGARARAAGKSYAIRVGIDLADDHPTVIGLKGAADKLKAATDGNVTMTVFPNSTLGNDTNMLSEVRSGAIQMMGIGDNILGTLVPDCAIDNVGFAFKDGATAFAAVDGAVGDIVRAKIVAAGLQPMHKIWDEGFRQITSGTHQINTPADLAGFKIRVPPSPISLSLFQSLGAAPVSLNIAELYTALQTHLVDGQENPFGNIETQKLYQVQKYCSVTNHMWVGYWMVMNAGFWKSLPPDYQQAVAQAFDDAADTQRVANQKYDDSLGSVLKTQGMSFATPDPAPFRQKLVAAGFYSKWKQKFGADLWAALEKYTGPLG